MRIGFLAALAIIFAPLAAFAASDAVISFEPQLLIQGDPVMVQIIGVPKSSVKGISFGGKALKVLNYSGKPTAFSAIDLSGRTGTTTIKARLSDGEILLEDVIVFPRQKSEATLGIPEKLGGDTASSQKTLVDTLAAENAELAALHTGTKAFWTMPFGYPVENPVVTDTYGYTRLTGSYSISHKGTDYRAPIGTPVLAMNRGVVRLAKTFRNYGNAIVIDHGLGLMTLYMHLSKLKVKEGELVTKGQAIGLSGDSGYAAKPHLHLSVRINGVSIDPEVFMSFFKKLQ